MERVMSVEEKVRRAEEIYRRRKQGEERPIAKVSVNDDKKNIKLFKKMIIQIIVSVFIYLGVYVIQNNKYIFSDDFINRIDDILSYDTNFIELYEMLKNQVVNLGNIKDNSELNNEQNSSDLDMQVNNENNNGENNLDNNDNQNQGQQNAQTSEQSNDQQNGQSSAQTSEQSNDQQNGQSSDQSSEQSSNQQNEQSSNQSSEQSNAQENNATNLTQSELDVQNIKNTTTFIKPIDGVITSRYGQTDRERSSVPKEHTGTDIAAKLGTKIKSATPGEVVLVAEQDEGYGKYVKIQIGQISIVYAHCNNIYVNQGDRVEQGQEIAEVGTTGNSTGPHLHFEVRFAERTVDPQSVLEI